MFLSCMQPELSLINHNHYRTYHEIWQISIAFGRKKNTKLPTDELETVKYYIKLGKKPRVKFSQ